MELRRAIKGFSSGFRRGFRTEKQSQESLHSVTRTGDKQAADIWNDDLSWPVVVQAFRRAATARNICSGLVLQLAGDCFSPFRIQFGPWGIIGTHSEAAFGLGRFQWQVST